MARRNTLKRYCALKPRHFRNWPEADVRSADAEVASGHTLPTPDTLPPLTLTLSPLEDGESELTNL
jgi:hypothetical protein